MGTPPPDCNILESIGGGFCTGGMGGSAWYFLKGVYNPPSGARLVGGSQALLMNAPRLPRIAGWLAVLCGLDTALERAMAYARRKEDPWNNIISSASACGVLTMHRGLAASARWALLGGASAAAIEWAIFKLDKYLEAQETEPRGLQKT